MYALLYSLPSVFPGLTTSHVCMYVLLPTATYYSYYSYYSLHRLIVAQGHSMHHRILSLPTYHRPERCRLVVHGMSAPALPWTLAPFPLLAL